MLQVDAGTDYYRTPMVLCYRLCTIQGSQQRKKCQKQQEKEWQTRIQLYGTLQSVHGTA